MDDAAGTRAGGADRGAARAAAQARRAGAGALDLYGEGLRAGRRRSTPERAARARRRRARRAPAAAARPAPGAAGDAGARARSRTSGRTSSSTAATSSCSASRAASRGCGSRAPATAARPRPRRSSWRSRTRSTRRPRRRGDHGRGRGRARAAAALLQIELACPPRSMPAIAAEPARAARAPARRAGARALRAVRRADRARSTGTCSSPSSASCCARAAPARCCSTAAGATTGSCPSAAARLGADVHVRPRLGGAAAAGRHRVLLPLRGQDGVVAAFYPEPDGRDRVAARARRVGELERATRCWRRSSRTSRRCSSTAPSGAREHWLVPIDDCFRLVGLIRTHWRGLTGGREVWAGDRGFFED